jgi:hypothetical protein
MVHPFAKSVDDFALLPYNCGNRVRNPGSGYGGLETLVAFSF